MDQSNVAPDFVIFLGRFHPLLVHLPIGMLIIGVLLYFFSTKENFKHLKKSIPFVLAIGAISAIMASIFGFLLSYQGGYDEEALSDHQLMGITVTIISVLSYISSVWKRTKKKRIINSIMMVMILIGLSFTGHLGGNLTHGSTYLTQYAPAPIRKVIGLAPKPEKRPIVQVLDSADVFLDVIKPLIINKCASCHNSEKSKGDLLLLSYNDMIKGGENGPAIVAGNLQKSELFKRITLPQDHKDFMPPEGKRPFSEDDVKLIKFWIENGAISEGLLSDIELEDNEITLFEGFLGIEGENKSILNTTVAAADSVVVSSLQDKGFLIRTVSNSSHLLDVKKFSKEVLTQQNLNDLLKLKKQIVYLDLSKSDLKNEQLEMLGELQMLVRLNINSNPITSKGITYLKELENLESLNIYDTEVDVQAVGELIKLKKLKSLYLWKTNINKSQVEELKKMIPKLNIVFGE